MKILNHECESHRQLMKAHRIMRNNCDHVFPKFPNRLVKLFRGDTIFAIH